MKKTPLAFCSLHQPPYFCPSLYSSHPPINSSDNVSHRCSHYSARGASPLHLPVMDFQCFEHLPSHMVMSLPWVASLCKLFRNAWTLSVLLYSFRHYPIPRQRHCATPTFISCCTESKRLRLPFLCGSSSSWDWLDPKETRNRVIMSGKIKIHWIWMQGFVLLIAC